MYDSYNSTKVCVSNMERIEGNRARIKQHIWFVQSSRDYVQMDSPTETYISPQVMGFSYPKNAQNAHIIVYINIHAKIPQEMSPTT